MPIVVKTVTVPAKGVGRKDYSANVEFSVEPIVRSYQEVYNYDATWTLNPGETKTVDVVIPSDTVVLLYDFLVAVPQNVLLTLEVRAVDKDGTVSPIIRKSAYQKVEHHHSRGAPVFQIIRVTITNHSALTLISVAVNCMGIYTSEKEYYMRVA